MAYYIIKPVRDALILTAKTPEFKSYMGAAQAILLIFVVKGFSLLSSKVARQVLITWVTLFFISNLVLFNVFEWVRVPMGTIGIIFYVWIGMFNLLVVAAEARYDGKFILRTNTDLPAAEVAQTYKSLWRVERTFRETKSTLEVRPIFHHNDETTIGHIVAGFLALRLEVDLQRRLDECGVKASWPTLMRNLVQVQAVRVESGGKTYLLRTDLQGSSHQAFQAAGMRPPSPATMMA